MFAPVIGVPRVVDGDSLVVNGQKIRLFGIDAWEHGQYCLDTTRQLYPCGDMATAFLKGLIKTNPVHCQPLRHDRYHRLVSRCTLQGVDLGQVMVERGWAVAYTHYSKAYLPFEQSARAQRLGGWQGLPYYESIPPEKWRAAKRARHSHSVYLP
ncbi:MAG: thermonuclease family protein [Magnetococcales bacterium]|nr:thermonuclease family protein [Magnetococcales bacterium]